MLRTRPRVLKMMNDELDMALKMRDEILHFELTEAQMQQLELQETGRVWAPAYRPTKMEYRGVPVIVKG